MESKQKIYFRADAGAQIGYGHFIRSLALADMLKDDFDCTFFTQSPSDYQKKEVDHICKLVVLPADNSHFNLFLEELVGEEIVVLDNYYFTTDYQKRIKDKGCKVVCIDDIHDKHYVADIVINCDLTDTSVFSVEPYTQLCLGLEWALLRSPFLQSVDLTKKEDGHWLIAFGGSDYYNLTEKFIRLVQNNNQISQISVIVGDAYQYIDSLKHYSNISVKKNLSASEMALLMQKCEYAIVSSSGICLEALSQKCKVITGYYVNNQMEFYREIVNKELVVGIGELLKVKEINVKSFKPMCLMDFSKISNNYKNLFLSLI